MSNTPSEEEVAAAHEGRAAVSQAQQNFDRVGDRLDELQRDHDNEDARDAFRQIEDLVMDMDDAMYEAQQVFDDVIEDES